MKQNLKNVNKNFDRLFSKMLKPKNKNLKRLDITFCPSLLTAMNLFVSVVPQACLSFSLDGKRIIETTAAHIHELERQIRDKK